MIRLVARIILAAVAPCAGAADGGASAGGGAPFCKSELLFPLEHWHNHGSCVVECPNGDLLACWFNGSGERTADDVKVEGARLRRAPGTSRQSRTPVYCGLDSSPAGAADHATPT